MKPSEGLEPSIPIVKWRGIMSSTPIRHVGYRIHWQEHVKMSIVKLCHCTTSTLCSKESGWLYNVRILCFNDIHCMDRSLLPRWLKENSSTICSRHNYLHELVLCSFSGSPWNDFEKWGQRRWYGRHDDTSISSIHRSTCNRWTDQCNERRCTSYWSDDSIVREISFEHKKLVQEHHQGLIETTYVLGANLLGVRSY